LLTRLKHVFPAPFHSFVPAFPKIHPDHLAPPIACLTAKVLHSSRGHDIQAPSVVQESPRSPADLQYRSVYCAFRMYNPHSQSTRQVRQTRYYSWREASGRDRRELDMRPTDTMDAQNVSFQMENRIAR